MRKLLAGLLVFIFVPIYLFVFLIFNLQAVLLNSSEVKKSLKTAGFYDKLIPSVVEDTYKPDAKSEILTRDELSDTFVKAIPPDDLQVEFEKSIDQLYPYILSEAEGFSLQFDLKEYKDRFLKESESLLLQEIKSLPKCTKKQLNNFNLQGSNKLPNCKPPGFTDKEILEGVINGGLDEILVDVPNELTVTEKGFVSDSKSMVIGIEQTPEESLTPLRETLSKRNSILLAGFGILIALLIVIALLRWGSYKSMAKWVGWTLILANIIFLPVSFLIYYSTSLIQGIMENLGQSAILLSSAVIDLMEKMFYTKALPETIVIGSIAVGLIVIPAHIRHRTKTHPNS